eukprot:1187044-Prorocentrum_minimum.AAC.2
MPRRPGTSSTINAACTASTGGLNTVRSATGSAVPLSAEVGATAAGELLGTVVCWDPGSWGRARGSSWGSDGGKVDKESDCWLWWIGFGSRGAPRVSSRGASRSQLRQPSSRSQVPKPHWMMGLVRRYAER